MPHGSELESQWENQCEGTTEAPCIPLHKRKQAQREPGTCLESQRCQVSGLRLSYRRKGEDSESPSPSWEPLGAGHKKRVIDVQGNQEGASGGGEGAIGDVGSPGELSPSSTFLESALCHAFSPQSRAGALISQSHD